MKITFGSNLSIIPSILTEGPEPPGLVFGSMNFIGIVFRVNLIV